MSGGDGDRDDQKDNVLDEDALMRLLEREDLFIELIEAPVTKPANKGKRRPLIGRGVKKEDSDLEPKVVGGFAFLLSLIALLPSGIVTVLLAAITFTLESINATGVFVGATTCGALLAHFLVRSQLSVFIHELKHSLVSGFVGNKWKKMHVEGESGFFEYSYTKKTAHYNAFISLAPYILPIISLVMALIAFSLFRHNHEMSVLLVGLAYGADVVLCLRDISPIQTDITTVRGGYRVGLLYITAWNLATLGILLAWVFNGIAGLGLLLKSFSFFFFNLHAFLRGVPGVEG